MSASQFIGEVYNSAMFFMPYGYISTPVLWSAEYEIKKSFAQCFRLLPQERLLLELSNRRNAMS